MAAEAESKKPAIDGFKIKGKLKGSWGKITETLSSITFIEIVEEKSQVSIAYIESKDINKNPYLFSIIKMKPDEIEVVYSITPEISPTKRRMDVIHYLLNILSLIGDDYSVDNKILLQIIDDALKQATKSISFDYSKLYTEYDVLKKEAADLKKKCERLGQQVEALSSQNYELKSENDQLKIRLQQLEKMSTEALKVKVQNWILEHNGSINIPEFCKVYGTVESQVEEALNQLVSEGYLVSID